MKTMKKIYKRFLTIVLAVSLTLTCSVVTSAAELDESSMNNDEMAIVFVSDNGIIDIVPIDECGNVEYVVAEPLNSGYSESNPIYSHTYYNQAVNDKVTVSRAVPVTGYIVVKLKVQGSAKIKVNVKSGILWSTLYEDSVTNGTCWKRSNAAANQGIIVEMTVTPLVNNTTYTLKFWVE